MRLRLQVQTVTVTVTGQCDDAAWLIYMMFPAGCTQQDLQRLHTVDKRQHGSANGASPQPCPLATLQRAAAAAVALLLLSY
jgi:hypothetical protein